MYTRGRHEKKAAETLSRKAIPVFLPLVKKKSRWKDRWKIVDAPLFTSYLFVNAPPDPGSQLAVLKTPGVVR
ncbi:MAG: transcription termination/antitermination NusG family protein, partial [Nitrospirota bacterium]